MSDYRTIDGLDRARYEALLNAPLPNPLPANAVLVVGADWCPDTQRSVMSSGYPSSTYDGAPIYYLNDANPAAHDVLRTLPGRQILGGGVDSATPPVRPVREYNYPTVVSIENGSLGRVLYADTVPPNGLLVPDQLGELWQRGEADRARRANFPQYNAERAAPLFAANPGAAIEPNHVYAIVSSNCGHCHELLARSGYPTRTQDGRPITYLNLATTNEGPVDPEDARFFTTHFGSVKVQGFPTFVTSDANGKLTQAAVGPDPIIQQFFPKVLATEAARSAAQQPEVAALAQTLSQQGLSITQTAAHGGPLLTPDTRDMSAVRSV